MLDLDVLRWRTGVREGRGDKEKKGKEEMGREGETEEGSKVRKNGKFRGKGSLKQWEGET